MLDAARFVQSLASLLDSAVGHLIDFESISALKWCGVCAAIDALSFLAAISTNVARTSRCGA